MENDSSQPQTEPLPAESTNVDEVLNVMPGATDDCPPTTGKAGLPRKLVAIAAIGAVALGAAGFYAGTLAGSDPAGFERPGGATSGENTGRGSGRAREGHAPSARPAEGLGSATLDVARPGAWVRTVFTSTGLPAEGGTGHVFTYDARAAATKDAVARIAEAFGVAGDVRDDGWSWSVGATGDGGPSISVSKDGNAVLNFRSSDAGPWVAPAKRSSKRAASDVKVEPVEDSAASKALVDAMRKAGVDPSEFEVSVSPKESVGDDTSRWVTARRVVGETVTHDTWTATVTSEGLTSLSGSLATVVDLGAYDVISPADAVARLSDPRFAPAAQVAYVDDEVAVTDAAAVGPARGRATKKDAMVEVPDRAGAIVDTAGSDSVVDIPGPDAQAAEVPQTPLEPGAKVDWPVREVTLVSSRLVVMQHWSPEHGQLFLPAYELSDASGNAWTVLALKDSMLDFATE